MKDMGHINNKRHIDDCALSSDQDHVIHSIYSNIGKSQVDLRKLQLARP